MRIKEKTRKVSATVLSVILLAAGIIPLLLPDYKILADEIEEPKTSIALELYTTNKNAAVESEPVTDNPKFTDATRLTVTSGDFYKRSANFYMIVDWNGKIDLSQIGDNGYFIIWVKTPNAINITVNMICSDYSTGASFTLETQAVPGWQEIKILKKDMTIESPDFDFKNLIGLKVSPTESDFLSAGESALFGIMEIYDGKVNDPSVPELVKKMGLWRDSAFAGYSSISKLTVSDNENFTECSSFTVLNDEYYDKDTGFYLFVDWNAGIDLSAIGNKGYFKFYIKTPHSVTFKIEVLHTEHYYRAATFEITTSDNTEWQEIKVARQEMNINDESFDFSELIGLKVIPVSTSFLQPGESICFGQLEVYDEELEVPDDGTINPELKKEAHLWRDGSLAAYSKIATVGVSDNEYFASAKEFTVLSDEYYSHDTGVYLLVDWNAKIDLSAIGDKGYIKFWVKTPHSVSFKVEILHTESYLRAGSFEIETTDSTDWQEINILREDMSLGDLDFDFKNLIGLKAVPTKGSFLDAGETITFGQIEIYDEDISTGGGEEEYVDLGEITPKKNYSVLFDATAKNAACSSEGIKVKTQRVQTSLFDTSMKVTLNDSEKFFSTLSNITFYTTWGKDINIGDALENGYLELWIKTPHSMTLNLVASSYWPTAKLKFTTEDGTDWQKITLNVADFVDGYESMSYNHMILLQFGAVSESNFIKNGESFEVGRITFFCPTADLGSSGADESYPISEDKLTKYDGTNFKLTSSTYGFWATGYSDPVEDRPLRNEYGGVSKEDPNYSKFQNIMRVWIAKVDEYYANPFGFMVYINRQKQSNGRIVPVDINDYILTGTLRVWIKVDKTITFNIGFRNGQANNDVTLNVPVTVSPTTENNGYVEVQIPLKTFYDTAVEKNVPFRFDKLDGLYISPVNKTKEGFLDENEELIYSTFEIWAKEAPEYENVEIIRTYTCGNGNDIILIDKNEVMPETTVVNAFRNTLEDSKMKNVLKQWSGNASLVDTYCIQTISDNTTDARLTSPYDTIQFRIPISYLAAGGVINENNISALNAVFYSGDVYTNAKLTFDGKDLLIDTTATGDLLFFSGIPGKDGPLYSESNSGSYLETDNAGDDTETEETSEDNTTKKYKKVVKKVPKEKSGNSKIIWLIVCIVGALAVLVLGFFGYRKFIAASMCLIITLGITLNVPINSFAETSDEKIAEIRLVNDHPGIPGYDAEYEVMVYYGTENDISRLDSSEYTLSSTSSEVKINGNKVILPASFKDNTNIDGFKIYARINSDSGVTAYYPIMIKNWKLELQDDFNGDKLNGDIWSGLSHSAAQVPQDNGKYCQAYVSDDCVKVENGNLVMRILSGKDGTAYSKNEIIDAEFLMPRITTAGKFTQKYGCFMTSIKMPYNTTAGSNSGIWLLPATGSWGTNFFFDNISSLSGFSCGEIDIIEYSPAWLDGEFQSAFHYWESTTLVKGTGAEVRTKYPKFTTGEYVNMACVWTENSCYIYYDGILQRKVKNLEATGEEAYILFTMQTAGYGNNPSWTGAFTEADLPQMVCSVDYLKVFS